MDPVNEELTSLRDKANLALSAMRYLQDGQPLRRPNRHVAACSFRRSLLKQGTSRCWLGRREDG